MTNNDPFQLGYTLFNNIGIPEDNFNQLVKETYINLWSFLRDAEYSAQLVFSHLVENIDQWNDEFAGNMKQELVSQFKAVQSDESEHIELSDNAVQFLGGHTIDHDKISKQVKNYHYPNSILIILLVINLGEIGGVGMLGNFYKNTKSHEWKEKLKGHLRDESQHVKLQQDLCKVIAKNYVKRPEVIQKIIFRPLFPWRFHSTPSVLSRIKELTGITDPQDLFRLMDTNFFNDFFQTTIQLKYPLIKLLNIDMKFEEFERITKTNIGASLINLYKNL